MSEVLCINAVVVQGLAFGPPLHIISTSDLKMCTLCNSATKYADDVTMVIPASNTSFILVELANVNAWAVSSEQPEVECCQICRTFCLHAVDPQLQFSPCQPWPLLGGNHSHPGKLVKPIPSLQLSCHQIPGPVGPINLCSQGTKVVRIL